MLYVLEMEIKNKYVPLEGAMRDRRLEHTQCCPSPVLHCHVSVSLGHSVTEPKGNGRGLATPQE